MKAIKVYNLTKYYEIFNSPHDRFKELIFGRWKKYSMRHLVLDNLTFEVPFGRCVGIIGKNGAGKSTLLQIIAGTMSQTSGLVEVNGKVAAVLELGSGFNPEFTGRQNINLYGSLFGLSGEELSNKFDLIKDFADIGDFIDLPLKLYSSGMQARLAFSVIAHVEAEILIIDEALSVGDAQFVQKCMSFLRDFKSRGTILFVTHDLGAVTGFCDEAIWLLDGKIRYRGSAKDACELYYAYTQSGIILPANNSIAARERDTESFLSSSKATESSPDYDTSNTINLDIKDNLQLIETYGFNINTMRHGNGDATIISVELLADDGTKLGLCYSSQQVIVKIRAQAIKSVSMPIVGFIIKDRLGQPLIGGNTYHKYKFCPVPIEEGEEIEAVFGFKLPILAVGDYSVVAAIANGTLSESVHLDWLHDAITFKVISSSIDGVLVGVPLDTLAMHKL